MRAIFPRLDEELELSLIREFFADRPKGFFVEVGANEPVNYSMTWHLEQLGWSGILIEPLAEKASLLRGQRSAKVFETACGAPEQHQTKMRFMVGDNDGVGSTLAERFADPTLQPDDVRQVPVVTLDSLIDGTKPDFVSIDVEGFETSVLRGFSLQKYRPTLVIIEDRVRDLSVHRSMVENGYKLVRRTSRNNSWYVPQDFDFPVSALGQIQLFRKLYIGLPIRAMKHRWRMRKADHLPRVSFQP